MELDGEPMIFPGTQAWWIFQVNQPFINFPGRAGAVRGLRRSGRGGVFFFGRRTEQKTQRKCNARWWFHFLKTFSPLLGEMIQFDYI